MASFGSRALHLSSGGQRPAGTRVLARGDRNDTIRGVSQPWESQTTGRTRRCRKGVAIVVIVAGLGCGSAPSNVRQEPPLPPASGGEVTEAQAQGQWHSAWGTLVLRVVGDEVWGAYDHDEGTVRGRFDHGVFRGWWCELPSRSRERDSGDVEFRFRQGPHGLLLDGRWRHGQAGDWLEDWDLAVELMPSPTTLEARFENPSLFCAHPPAETGSPSP